MLLLQHTMRKPAQTPTKREMAKIAIPLHKRSGMHRHAKVIMLLLQHAMSTTLVVLGFHK
jgi:hypothetical protein